MARTKNVVERQEATVNRDTTVPPFRADHVVILLTPGRRSAMHARKPPTHLIDDDQLRAVEDEALQR